MPAMIRASYTKLGLKFLKRGHPRDWEALCTLIGAEPLAQIRAASTLAWLPAEIHAAVADATIAQYGQREAREAWRDVMLAAFDGSMLRPLVSGALRFYGKKPSSIMRMTPQGWSLAFKECGKAWMEDRGETRAEMCFEGLPRALAQSPGIVESFAANCDAALSYAECHGKVLVDRSRLARGQLSIEVSWMTKSDAPPEGSE